MLEFKRGIVISAKYETILINKAEVIQQLIIRDTEGKEYSVNWQIFNMQDLLGEGDKVSFLVNENDFVSILRLNPFYSEE